MEINVAKIKPFNIIIAKWPKILRYMISNL